MTACQAGNEQLPGQRFHTMAVWRFAGSTYLGIKICKYNSIAVAVAWPHVRSATDKCLV